LTVNPLTASCHLLPASLVGEVRIPILWFASRSGVGMCRIDF